MVRTFVAGWVVGCVVAYGAVSSQIQQLEVESAMLKPCLHEAIITSRDLQNNNVPVQCSIYIIYGWDI